MTQDKAPPKRKLSGRKKSVERGAGVTGGTGPPCEGASEKGETTTARRNRRLAGIRPRISVEELRNAFRRQASVSQDDSSQPLFDPMAKAQESKTVIRSKTGVVYDERMALHQCPWDPNFLECPDRLLQALKRCEDLRLLDRCQKLEPRMATEEEILALHTRSLVDLLYCTKGEKDVEKLEELSSHYDSIYLHPDTYEAAMLSAGSTLTLVDHIASGEIQNGIAIVRPPGHHASKTEFNGFCYFNNVALAAHWALERHKLSRILIVDWDVHHGQGTQQMFYEDPRVLYFSIHRYEHGTFWPELRESDYTAIGKGQGKGFNFNVPLNKTGMKNEDFLAIFHQVLLPVAYEFNPELIIVSCGYDAAVGCPEGEMEITPAFYAHLTSSLMCLAQGKVAIVLEGGYCMESTSEGVARTLGALLGDPCPMLMDPITRPSCQLHESLLNLIYVQRPHWKCFQYQGSFTLNEDVLLNKHVPTVKYLGKAIKQIKYDTRDVCPVQSQTLIEENRTRLNRLKEVENIKSLPKYKLSLVYDEEMNSHKNLLDKDHPEKPERTERIWSFFKQFGVTERSLILKSRKATREEVEEVHSKDHVESMFGLHLLTEESVLELQDKYKSLYLHPMSNNAALLSSGSLLQVVDSVCGGESQAGIGVIRPPGHHAEMDRPHGFCLYNNVAVAARYAATKFGYQRIMILDWDVHHGNGIQHIFESDPSVLYVSIHRYDDGLFFPSSEDGNYDKVGTEAGKGFNINIPWNKSGMGDAEYMSAMLQVVMPIAYQFNPQLVLVSAGFDAARGDPLGGCRVTPECYGHMTYLLTTLAQSRVVLALEGGYNTNVISYCMTMCAKALLGDPLPALGDSLVPNKNAVESIINVIRTHSEYWSCLCFYVALPVEDVLAQGFGGKPQPVESGVSGSEISSCNSSPVSSPSTASPMYVSAPSSPDKPMDCEAEICTRSKEQLTATTTTPKDSMESDPSNINSDSSPGFVTPTSHNLKPPVRTRRSSQKSSDSSVKAKETSAEDKTVKRIENSVTPRRNLKGNVIGNEHLKTAASTIHTVKSETAVAIDDYSVGKTDTSEFSRLIWDTWDLKNSEYWKILQPRPVTQSEVPFLFDNISEESLSETEKSKLLKAVGSAVDVVAKVVNAECQNGLAVVQLSSDILNVENEISSMDTAAIASRYAVNSLNVERVMVIDLDCMGDQYKHACGDGKQILTFCLCVHRMCLESVTSPKSKSACEASDSNFVIDLNCDAFKMEDYYAIFHQLILPVAYEFSPELIILSTRYVMAAHCENIYPVVYTHLIGLLTTLANGRVVVVSDVGRCEKSVVECVSASLSALRDVPCPSVPYSMETASPIVKTEILNVFTAKKTCLGSLQSHAQYSSAFSSGFKSKAVKTERCSKGSVKNVRIYEKCAVDGKYVYPACLVYDDAMLNHFNYEDKTHPECPERIKGIYHRLKEFSIVERCLRVKASPALPEQLEELHSPKHFKFMTSLSSKKPGELINLQENYESVYLHRQTNGAALLAAGSVVAVVDSVLKGDSHRAIAVVRPPGHHAERNEPCGFCFYNNVAVGAKHAINAYGLTRVLILDWDIHHGNGIQHMFESDHRVLYISIHRYDNGRFFPGSQDANYNRVGIKKGKGFNINIPWNRGGMGDGDYMAAMTQIVLPVAFQFNPQLVLVSSGFDAAVGDPLGGCRVTPECYGHMTKLLMQLAGGKVVVALEGGYNLSSISYCMVMCAKALLGDPIVSLQRGLVASQSAVDSLTSVISSLKKYWSSLDLKSSSSGSTNPYSLPSPLTENRSSKSHETKGNTSTMSIDDLSTNLCGINLNDSSSNKLQGSLLSEKEDKTSKMETSSNPAPKESLKGVEEESLGAVGVSSADNINTFLLSDNPAAEQMYAVVPLDWCPHLEQVKEVPSSGMNTGSECEECQGCIENWICLTCYRVFCGRFVNEHMLMHGVTEEHYMVLSFSDLSVWCYACDSYVHHDALLEAKRAAHLDKFGEDIPNSS